VLCWQRGAVDASPLIRSSTSPLAMAGAVADKHIRQDGFVTRHYHPQLSPACQTPRPPSSCWRWLSHVWSRYITQPVSPPRPPRPARPSLQAPLAGARQAAAASRGEPSHSLGLIGVAVVGSQHVIVAANQVDSIKQMARDSHRTRQCCCCCCLWCCCRWWWCCCRWWCLCL
jgi:hypothetical protein